MPNLRRLFQTRIVTKANSATGVDKGSRMLRETPSALYGSNGDDDVSGEALEGGRVKKLGQLDMDFFNKMGVYTRVTRATALASSKGRIIHGDGDWCEEGRSHKS